MPGGFLSYQIVPLLVMKATTSDKSFARPVAGEELIRFEDIHKSFGTKHVFEHLQLSVMEGEILTVMGGSGMGKSVLLKCLIGLLYPDSGRIIFEGQDLTEFEEKDFLHVRRRIAMSFKGPRSSIRSQWARTSPTRSGNTSPR